MKFRMLSDNLLVKEIEIHHKTLSLSSRDSREYRYRYFRVIEIGPGFQDRDGNVTPVLGIKPGDIILSNNSSDADVVAHGKGYQIMTAANVTAVVEGDLEVPEGYEIRE